MAPIKPTQLAPFTLLSRRRCLMPGFLMVVSFQVKSASACRSKWIDDSANGVLQRVGRSGSMIAQMKWSPQRLDG